MKNQRNNIFKAKISKRLILFFLFFLIQFLTPKFSEAAYPDPITCSQVIEYLAGQGIKAADAKEIFPTDDWISANFDGTHTKVIVEGGRIIGHENVEI